MRSKEKLKGDARIGGCLIVVIAVFVAILALFTKACDQAFHDTIHEIKNTK